MFNISDNNTLVLIDWGLSYIADSDRKNVPEALNTLSVQPMHPFSSFLFKKNVIEKYEVFIKNLKKEGVKITRDSVIVVNKIEKNDYFDDDSELRLDCKLMPSSNMEWEQAIDDTIRI